MTKYFYSDGTHSYRPCTIEERKEKGRTRETKVWFQELGDWKPAGTVNELVELFTLIPPPQTKTISTPANKNSMLYQKPPKTWLVESILVTLFCCLPFGIAGIVNASKVESRFFAGDIIGANQSSSEAKKWTLVSFWIGIAGILLYFVLLALGIASSL